MTYGGDPCIDEDSLPSWVWDYATCPVCDCAEDNGYNYAEFGITVCECVECPACLEMKSIYDDFCEGSTCCDSCFDEKKYDACEA